MKNKHPLPSIIFVLLLFASCTVQAEVALAPRVSFLGSSLRYSATPPSAGLNSEVISQSFQDVIRSKFARDTTRAGLDESMYFRLRSGGIGSKSMLRLRRMSLSQAIGLYAEKRLVITEGWNPVAKQNAPQNDLWKYENGRRIGAQVKTNIKGDPATYVREMRKDYRAEKFLIPDDHYEPTLQHLRQKAEQARAAGDTIEVAFFERQAQRLGKIGATYTQLESEAQFAAKLALARIISARVGWVITGVMVVPSAYMNFDAYYSGKISGNEFAYNLGKDALATGAGIGGATLGNILFKGSPWAVGGTAAVCVLIVQEGFLILQYGSFENAFSQPQFWIVTAGNVGGAGLGVAGAIYVGQLGACLGSAFGPIGTGVGATMGAVVGGGAGAMIGSYGGTEISRIALDLCSPEWVYAQYDQKIDARLGKLKAAMN
jgi:hypothetical protein